MQPEHTEPLFILAAAGLLQGHDPEGMKNRASIQLTSVTLPGVKTKHLCIFYCTGNGCCELYRLEVQGLLCGVIFLMNLMCGYIQYINIYE